MAAVSATPRMSNAQARTLFLASALRKSQFVIPNQNYAPGSTLTINLPRAGIARGVLLDFTIPIVVTLGGGTVAQSPKGPFNFVNRVHAVDYNGIDRVSASAYSLYLLSLLKVRNWEPSGQHPYQDPGETVPYAGAAPGFTTLRWNYPIATGNVVFSLWVPFAYGMNDPRGALPLNVSNANSTIQLECNGTLFSTTGQDSPFIVTGAATVTANAGATINATLYYWDPIALPGQVDPGQFAGSVPVPFDDLNLVHEVKSIVDSTGIAAGTEKLYTYQSGRDYYRVIASVMENGQLNSQHISRSRWVYDGNTPCMDEGIIAHLTRAQTELGRDLPPGMLYYDFSNRPWDANSYGSLAWGLTTTSAFNPGNPTYIEYLTDALYYAQMANA